MIYLPNVIAGDAPPAPEDEIVLKPVRIVHNDGSNETAYVQDLAQQADVHTTAHRVHKHLTIVYLIVGTVAIALSAYATIVMLRKK